METKVLRHKMVGCVAFEQFRLSEYRNHEQFIMTFVFPVTVFQLFPCPSYLLKKEDCRARL
jgi:ABC-type uncharacterized transport system permease subunit